ncbi:hypothetical protein F5J12DRAFT_783686 [Pisolithus orientalis]|uniref:uncharacterized protein n=1 Tax=Pisolithus orientalis TaxID=936130 RepID=UPI0022254E26|nr:uncharacterized protein F5J12DRAFT_783686 [Pisolithus orientalis]KAI6003260.1 hypothetical protein F5J12DRAFT_783686 [Pisolithus orientalis]
MLPMPPEVHRNVLSHSNIETSCTVVKMHWLKVGINIYGDYSEKMAQMDQEDVFMSWGRRGSLDGPNSLFGIKAKNSFLSHCKCFDFQGNHHKQNCPLIKGKGHTRPNI